MADGQDNSPRYLDGITSIPHSVRLRLTEKYLLIYKNEEEFQKFLYSDIFVKEDWHDQTGGIFGFRDNVDAGLTVHLENHYLALQRRLPRRQMASFMIPTGYRHLFLMLVGAVIVAIISFPALGYLSRGLTHLVPMKAEKKLGELALEQMQIGMDKCDDKIAMESLKKISDRLVRANGQKNFSPEIYLYGDSMVNAFALPGNKMVVLSGFLADTRSENEIAAVMAHEMGHMVHRDSLEQFIQSQSLEVIALLMAGSGSYDGLASFATTLQAMNYSREKELEADKFGAKLLIKAGYSPTGLSSFLTRMEGGEKGNREQIDEYLKFLSTHPETAERVKRVDQFAKGVKDGFRPSLTAVEFVRLKNACQKGSNSKS